MRRKAFFILLLAAVILLGGCSSGKTDGQGDSGEKASYDLGGKTYYNTVNEYNNDDHSWIRFNKDGTFFMTDNVEHGRYEFQGKWSVKDKTVTLEIGEESTAKTKASFEIKDGNTLVLQNKMGGSKPDQIFSTNKSGWSTYDKDDKDKQEAAAENGEEGETSTSAVPCQAISTEYKSYWAKAGGKPWNLDVVVEPANTTDKIVYKSNDENVVKVDEEGNVSAINPGNTTIEITCGKQSLTVKFETRE